MLIAPILVEASLALVSMVTQETEKLADVRHSCDSCREKHSQTGALQIWFKVLCSFPLRAWNGVLFVTFIDFLLRLALKRGKKQKSQ